MADITSPTQASVGDDQTVTTKSRRKVRMFAQDSSSSDEGAAIEQPAKLNDDSEWFLLPRKRLTLKLRPPLDTFVHHHFLDLARLNHLVAQRSRN